MLLPHAVQIGVVMYIYEGYKGGGRAIKGRARDKITLDVTPIICHIHFQLTRLTVQAQIPSSVSYFMTIIHIKSKGIMFQNTYKQHGYNVPKYIQTVWA